MNEIICKKGVYFTPQNYERMAQEMKQFQDRFYDIKINHNNDFNLRKRVSIEFVNWSYNEENMPLHFEESSQIPFKLPEWWTSMIPEQELIEMEVRLN